MRYIYSMQNLTFGDDGGLTSACQAKHPQQPWLCFMSPHMQDVIKTPFFMCADSLPSHRRQPVDHAASNVN